MDACDDLEGFLRAPLGKYYVGRTWLYFYRDPHVSGFVLWGHLNEQDLQATTRITPRVHAFAAHPHVAFIDGQRVEKMDAECFVVAANYLETHRAAMGDAISRLAVVHPPGMLGAAAAGFFQIVAPPYLTRHFANLPEAVQWLDINEGASLVAELDALHATASGVAPFLRDVRAALRKSLGRASLPALADDLGVSTRSLQRRLTEHETSFQRELTLTRIQAARELLADRDRSVTEIASAIGYSSLHHFSNAFHKVTGETPTQWRSRHVPGSADSARARDGRGTPRS